MLLPIYLMKELFTKSFWRDVKRTFDTALEGSRAEENAAQKTVDTTPRELPKPQTPTPPPTSGEQT